MTMTISLAQGGAAVPGKVSLRPDKRPRPLVLRVAAGDCLTINLQNLLAYQANPGSHDGGEEVEGEKKASRSATTKTSRSMSRSPTAMSVSRSTACKRSTASTTSLRSPGAMPTALIAPGASRSYTLYAEREGAFAASSRGATFGGEGAAGNVANGLFGQVVVVPKGGRTYRNTVTEEEMRLATTGRTPAGQPIVDYQARYPQREPWMREGKAGTPIINMVDGNEIISSESDAIVMGSNADGSFPPSTYPLEAVGKRNPALPNRLEPFRDFASQFQDETAATQAFPGLLGRPGDGPRAGADPRFVHDQLRLRRHGRRSGGQPSGRGADARLPVLRL